MRDEDIRALADCLLVQHGRHAAARALIEAGDCTEREDPTGARLWVRVFDRIRRLGDGVASAH